MIEGEQYSANYPVEAILTRSEKGQKESYWLAPNESPANLTLDLGCALSIKAIELDNSRNGDTIHRATKRFR